MKRWLLPALAILALAAGCGTAPTQQVEQNPMDLEWGGYTTASEAPAFGRPELSARAQEEVSPNDAVAAEMLGGGGMHDTRPPFLALRVVWGRMEYDSTNTTPTVWDGKISVSDGRLGVVRVIRFEPATDHLLPRTDRRVVEWVSQTTVHNDGLLLIIGLPRPEPPDSGSDTSVVDTMPPDTLPPALPDVVVSFETGPLTISFTLDEVANLDRLISVDGGNAVMFNGTLVDTDECPRGFLSGDWTHHPDSTFGSFNGTWSSDDGALTGFVEGRFGVNSHGRRVFFGKYIDANGQFEGFLRGVWQPASREPSGGSFKGVFYTPIGLPAGRLHGRWAADEQGVGTFQGVWKTHCGRWDHGHHGWAWTKWDDDHFDPSSLP